MCYDRALQEPLKSHTVLFKTIFKVAFVLNSHFRFLYPDSPSPTPGVEANQNPPWGGETSCYVKQVLLPVGTVTWLTGSPGCEVLVCVFVCLFVFPVSVVIWGFLWVFFKDFQYLSIRNTIHFPKVPLEKSGPL